MPIESSRRLADRLGPVLAIVVGFCFKMPGLINLIYPGIFIGTLVRWITHRMWQIRSELAWMLWLTYFESLR
jgi:uncharacterized membrane protein SpoIIM required for sporulation